MELWITPEPRLQSRIQNGVSLTASVNLKEALQPLPVAKINHGEARLLPEKPA